MKYRCVPRNRFVCPGSVALVITIVALGVCSGAVPAGEKTGRDFARLDYGNAKPQNAFAQIGGRRYHPFYSGGIGPQVHYANNSFFVAFQRFGGQPVVLRYDVEKQAWKGPVVASTKMPPYLQNNRLDAHGNPAMYVDRDGRIQLFFGCHGREGVQRVRSAQPYDITRWNDLPTVGKRATYPQVFATSDGKVRLVYRAGGHPAPWVMRTSDDDGETFGPEKRVVEMRVDPPHPRAAAYVRMMPSRDGKRIHCVWNYKEDNRERWPDQYDDLGEAVYRFNIYYMCRDPDGVWRNAEGERVKTPVSKHEADDKCMVYDSGDIFAYPRQRAEGPDGGLYLSFRTAVRDWRTGVVHVPTKHRLAYLPGKGGKWRVFEEMPDEWPAVVRRALVNPQSKVFVRRDHGGTGPAREPFGALFSRHHRDSPTSLYLWTAEQGVVTRQGGPAKCWKAAPGPDGEMLPAGPPKPEEFFNKFLYRERVYPDAQMLPAGLGFESSVVLYNPLPKKRIRVKLIPRFPAAEPAHAEVTPRILRIGPMQKERAHMKVFFDSDTVAEPAVKLGARVQADDLDITVEGNIPTAIRKSLNKRWLAQRRRILWQGPQGRPTLIAEHSGKPVTVDGKLSEETWNGEPSVAPNQFVHVSLQENAPEDTRVWLRHDGEDLYAAFRSTLTADRPDTPDATGRDQKTYLDESVELFCGPVPGRGKPHYLQVAVNTAGMVYDSVDGDSAADVPVRAAVQKKKSEWTAEIAVPLSAVANISGAAEDLTTGDTLRVLVARNHLLPEGRASAQFPAIGYTNHAPEWFACLDLAETQ